MNRLSSNFTIFYKLFIPVFYCSFFGALALLVVFSDRDDLPFFSLPLTKIIYVIVFLFILTLMWFTIADLKRVEQKEDDLYVTNYFKTYRYKKEDVSRITSYNFRIFEVISIHMRAKTKMGRKIRMIAAHKGVKDYLNQWLF